jgi:hypothetical protein
VGAPADLDRADMDRTEGSGGDEGNSGGVAQLGEHLLCKQGVTGSIPVVSTRFLGATRGWTA